jgi:hypothetical protein
MQRFLEGCPHLRKAVKQKCTQCVPPKWKIHMKVSVGKEVYQSRIIQGAAWKVRP